MALILSLETATTACSVALHRDGELVSLHEINNGYSHAENLTLLVQKALEDGNSKVADLEGVAVSKGPGSYTGLRIGVSTAKGLAYSLGIPMMAIDTLSSLAQQGIDRYPEGERFVPMLDARRMEVYSAVFDRELHMTRPIQAVILDESSFKEELAAHKTAFFGPGAEKYRDMVARHPNAQFLDGYFPSAKETGFLAEQAFREERFEDVAYFEPFYLKDFIAIKPKKLL